MPDDLNGWAILTRGTPFFSGGECGWHPVDDDISTAARQNLGGRNVRAAGLDVDIEAFGFVKTLVLGDVISGELRLGDPFQL